MRQLKRGSEYQADRLSDKLPLAITNFGEVVFVILSLRDYNQLVRQFKQPVRQPTEATQAVSQADLAVSQADYDVRQASGEGNYDVRQPDLIVTKGGIPLRLERKVKAIS